MALLLDRRTDVRRTAVGPVGIIMNKQLQKLVGVAGIGLSWGVEWSAAAWLLLTPLPNDMLFVVCPLGAACGSLLVAIARNTATNQPRKTRLAKLPDRLLVNPLGMACASNR